MAMRHHYLSDDVRFTFDDYYALQDQFKGLPVMDTHGKPGHLKHPVGKIENAWLDPVSHMLMVSGVVTEPIIAAKMRSREYSGLSIGYDASIITVNSTGESRCGGKTLKEISVCPQGEFRECLIARVQHSKTNSHDGGINDIKETIVGVFNGDASNTCRIMSVDDNKNSFHDITNEGTRTSFNEAKSRVSSFSSNKTAPFPKTRPQMSNEMDIAYSSSQQQFASAPPSNRGDMPNGNVEQHLSNHQQFDNKGNDDKPREEGNVEEDEEDIETMIQKRAEKKQAKYSQLKARLAELEQKVGSAQAMHIKEMEPFKTKLLETISKVNDNSVEEETAQIFDRIFKDQERAPVAKNLVNLIRAFENAESKNEEAKRALEANTRELSTLREKNLRLKNQLNKLSVVSGVGFAKKRAYVGGDDVDVRSKKSRTNDHAPAKGGVDDLFDKPSSKRKNASIDDIFETKKKYSGGATTTTNTDSKKKQSPFVEKPTNQKKTSSQNETITTEQVRASRYTSRGLDSDLVNLLFETNASWTEDVNKYAPQNQAYRNVPPGYGTAPPTIAPSAPSYDTGLLSDGRPSMF